MKINLYKLLEVEEREEFKIEGCNYDYRFRVYNNRIQHFDKELKLWEYSTLTVNALAGSEIIKLQKKKQFSQDELCVLKNIDKKYKLVARDKNGDLYAYPYRPMKGATYWGKGSHESLFTFNSLFTEIKWEDEEPVCIDDYVER